MSSTVRDNAKREPGTSVQATTDTGLSEWERKVLYHHRARTDLSNERKYLGWLRVSLGLITLGFVVERLDLFLARSNGVPLQEVDSALLWAPIVVFGMGSLTIAVATWEFFADRRRISTETPRGSWLLHVLILTTLVTVLLVAALLWVPRHT